MDEDSNHQYADFLQHLGRINAEASLTFRLNDGYNNISVFSDDPTESNVEMVKKIVSSNPQFCTQSTESGAFPIHIAAYSGDVVLVKFLACAVSGSVCFETVEGAYPLHLAASRGHTEICTFLFHMEPSVLSATTRQGLTPEDIARKSGNAELADILQFALQHMDEAAGYHSIDTEEMKMLTNQQHQNLLHQSSPAFKHTPAAVQRVHIPSQPQPQQQLAEEASLDSIAAANSLANPFPLDVSQLLLEGFHRASLLEDETEAEAETELAAPAPGQVRYEKYPRTAVEARRASASLMFNLSDELATHPGGQQGQRQQQGRGHGQGQGYRAGYNAPGGDIQLGISGKPVSELPMSLKQAPRSPFLVQLSAKPAFRAGTAGTSSRPQTTQQSLTVARTAAATEQSPRRPSTARPGGADRSPPPPSQQQQLHHTVQVVQELTAPALIITSASIIRAGSPRLRKPSRPPAPAAVNTGANDMQQSKCSFNDDVEAEGDRQEGRAEDTPQPQPPLYSLRRPASRPSWPRRSAVSTTGSSGRQQAQPSPVGSQQHGHPLGATQHMSKSGAASRRETNKSGADNLHFVKYALESRKLEGKASPPRVIAVPETAHTANEGREVVKEKVIIPRPYVQQVTIEPAAVATLAGQSSAVPESTLPMLYSSHRAFAPPKTLRSPRAGGPAACHHYSAQHSQSQQSPAVRQRLDLDRMAQEAARLSEDSTFVPSPRPVHNASAPPLREAPPRATTRAQRFKKLCRNIP